MSGDVAAKVKYLFDDDFAPGAAAAERPIAPSEHAQKLAEAETKGYREGFAAAEKEGTAVAERRLAVAFEHIGDALGRLSRGIAAVENRVESEAVELALAVARKLAPELVLREPLAEVAALATDCFKHLTSAPHIVVRVNDALHERARDRLAEIAKNCGFAGRLVVIAEPEIAVGDCKIEWADGGVIRNQAKTDLAIANAVGRYLGARQTASMPELGDIKL